jgi:phosphoenolpyruvate carboxykinase (ATP)
VATLPTAKLVIDNPTPEEFRDLVAQMPNAAYTEFDNYNVTTKVVSRSKASTYIVSDTPENHSDQCITREEYDRVAAIQDAYIADQEMVKVDGYIGNDPEFRTRARLFIEKRNANIAAMQQQLYYPCDDPDSEPVTTVIYTPNLEMPGYPNDRLIAVDLEAGVTRVFNSDYFGESKKGGLRMWNALVYGRGGLPLHAGAKVVPTADGGEKTLMIVGLSGTGKTTTTFTKQGDSHSVQDDFIACMPDGRIYTTENGCFAKTFGLDPRYEPVIHGAATSRAAYLENVSQDGETIDFFDTSYTKNGRCTFGLGAIEHHDGLGLTADALLILNKNQNIVPAIARLTPDQAAAYFMLGETTGTSAGGAEEAGKFLRVPGTNPFFPLLHAQQGNRMLELLQSHPMQVYVLNTGSIGGKDGEDGAKKIKIPHSSACVAGIAEDSITWEVDPDFGYEIAVDVPGIDDPEILQPRKLYERLGRLDDYNGWVERMKKERIEYFNRFPGLDEAIVAAIR